MLLRFLVVVVAFGTLVIIMVFFSLSPPPFRKWPKYDFVGFDGPS